MIDPYKRQAVRNIKKTQGQLECILKMIEEGEYCVDIVHQVNAALGLLNKTNDYILENHLLTCGVKQLGAKNPKVKRAFVKELIRVCNMASRF